MGLLGSQCPRITPIHHPDCASCTPPTHTHLQAGGKGGLIMSPRTAAAAAAAAGGGDSDSDGDGGREVLLEDEELHWSTDIIAVRSSEKMLHVLSGTVVRCGGVSGAGRGVRGGLVTGRGGGK